MSQQNNFLHDLLSGVADAVADVREKVVEEGWFGRVVTERGELPQWPEAREAEPQPEGLSGEILGPESQPMNTRDSAGLLEHGFVLDAQPMNPEPSPQWPQAALTSNTEQEQGRDREAADRDIEC
jgi:hypothetical protein